MFHKHSGKTALVWVERVASYMTLIGQVIEVSRYYWDVSPAHRCRHKKINYRERLLF